MFRERTAFVSPNQVSDCGVFPLAHRLPAHSPTEQANRQSHLRTYCTAIISLINLKHGSIRGHLSYVHFDPQAIPRDVSPQNQFPIAGQHISGNGSALTVAAEIR